jgi:hypothetical protein
LSGTLAVVTSAVRGTMILPAAAAVVVVAVVVVVVVHVRYSLYPKTHPLVGL